MPFVFLLDDLGEDYEGERKVESQLGIHWFIYMFNNAYQMWWYLTVISALGG